jgi:hypothetical protein
MYPFTLNWLSKELINWFKLEYSKEKNDIIIYLSIIYIV